MKYKYFIIALWVGLHAGKLNASNVVVLAQTTLIDGQLPPYNQLSPGDTIYMQAGLWDNLEIRNFKGTTGKPYIFINNGGIVTFSTDHNHAISIQNCQFFRLTGTGVKAELYGFQIDKVENGAGIGIGKLSSDFEIDHISIKNVPIAGIYAKTDPDCSGKTTREFFTQFNTSIHDNYIENAGNEGLYIGSTKYLGQTVKCNDKDTMLLPSVLEGVKVYNNIIRNSGWDGIQVSSASKNCSIYGNKIINDSQAEVSSQMSGILIGGGSKCDCYNNYITDGKGIGIELHGLGGNRIFNNVIINAGKTYFPDNFEASVMKYGIFVSDVSTERDSSFYILHNTIINPKSDGIRFTSIVSKKNLIASNAIINPGNFDYYENGNTKYKGVDSYVMITSTNSDITITNNYFSRLITDAKFDENYKLKFGSPLIDQAYTGLPQIKFDSDNNLRPVGNANDIGAYELQTINFSDFFDEAKMHSIAYPNPARNELFVYIKPDTKAEVTVNIFDEQGRKVFYLKDIRPENNIFKISLTSNTFPPGIYLCQVLMDNSSETHKFIKIQ